MNLTRLLTLLTYIDTSLALSRWLPTQQLLFEMSLNQRHIKDISHSQGGKHLLFEYVKDVLNTLNNRMA